MSSDDHRFIPFLFWFLDPWVEPVVNMRQPGRVTSHPVAAPGGCTIIPHARGTGLGKTGPTLITACHSHKGKRAAYPDPKRLIRPLGFSVICYSLSSGNLECGTFR